MTAKSIGSSISNSSMFVIKRSGERQPMMFDKITERNVRLAEGLDINIHELSQAVITSVISGMTTSDIDKLSCEECSSRSTYNPDYAELASRIFCSDIHKSTSGDFEQVLAALAANTNVRGDPNPLVCPRVRAFAQEHMAAIRAAIDYERDFGYSYLALEMMKKSYLNRCGGALVERPQDMLMRVALGIHGPSDRNGVRHEGDIEKALRTYALLADRCFTHATPTLFYSGSCRPQCSSCFVTTCGDSLEDITACWRQCATISKFAGGIGVDLSARGTGAYIAGTNGRSSGIIKLIKVFNEIARYVDQCFLGGTVVYTARGPRPIADVRAGADRVLTRDGSFREVLEVRADPLDAGAHELFGLRVVGACAPRVACTGEHPFLAVRDVPDLAAVSARIAAGTLAAEFVEARELRAGDFIGAPIPTYTRDLERLAHHTLETDDIDLDAYMHTSSVQELHILLARLMEHLPGRVAADDRTLRFRVARRHAHHARYMLLRLAVPVLGCSALGCSALGENENKVEREKEINQEEESEAAGEEEEELVFTLPRCDHTMFLLDVFRCNLHETYVFDSPVREQQFFVAGGLVFTRVLGADRVDASTLPAGARVFDLVVRGNSNYATNAGLAHNGGGKRKGAFALYLQPWHVDVEDFLDLRDNTGPEEMRARDIFPALYIPDIFFERLVESQTREGVVWSLFCPGEFPELVTLYGAEFSARYRALEAAGRFRRQVPIAALWRKIAKKIQETGLPYMISKDAVNEQSNHRNVGPITGLNLCCEVAQHHDKDNVAVCNLASVCVNEFYDAAARAFDFERFGAVVGVCVENLNLIIDKNFYPVEEARRNNLRNRPIGLGVQGLADLFFLADLPWESPAARAINQIIFEAMYFYALRASVDLAERAGPYATFAGSPLAEGKFQYELARAWDEGAGEFAAWADLPITHPANAAGRAAARAHVNVPELDWEALRARVRSVGARNSLLLAPMPTASTSLLLGNVDCFEVITSNAHIKKNSYGDFSYVNKHLYSKLKEYWSREFVDEMLRSNGSIQHVAGVPQRLKDIFKTVWEVPQRVVVDMAADRGRFIDQSQSMNVYLSSPSLAALSSLYVYGWKRGLKTLSYYVRSRPAVNAVKFTIKPKVAGAGDDKDKDKGKKRRVGVICTDDVCTACSA